jgi:hypothetical protein
MTLADTLTRESVLFGSERGFESNQTAKDSTEPTYLRLVAPRSPDTDRSPPGATDVVADRGDNFQKIRRFGTRPIRFHVAPRTLSGEQFIPPHPNAW